MVIYSNRFLKDLMDVTARNRPPRKDLRFSFVLSKFNYLLGKRGYVFGSIGLSVCLWTTLFKKL